MPELVTSAPSASDERSSYMHAAPVWHCCAMLPPFHCAVLPNPHAAPPCHQGAAAGFYLFQSCSICLLLLTVSSLVFRRSVMGNSLTKCLAVPVPGGNKAEQSPACAPAGPNQRRSPSFRLTFISLRGPCRPVLAPCSLTPSPALPPPHYFITYPEGMLPVASVEAYKCRSASELIGCASVSACSACQREELRRRLRRCWGDVWTAVAAHLFSAVHLFAEVAGRRRRQQAGHAPFSLPMPCPAGSEHTHAGR